MIRQPRRSTLFPYTTLSRFLRCATLVDVTEIFCNVCGRPAAVRLQVVANGARREVALCETHAAQLQARQQQRSEEHTSELQSRQYLVCRLLLEKKKKTYTCL